MGKDQVLKHYASEHSLNVAPSNDGPATDAEVADSILGQSSVPPSADSTSLTPSTGSGAAERCVSSDDERMYHLVQQPQPKVVSPRRTYNDPDETFASVPDNGVDSDNGSKASSIMSSDSEDDLNQMEDSDDPEEFGDLDFGEEPAEDDIVDDDEINAPEGDTDEGQREGVDKGNEDSNFPQK
ncbi:hypothetical protein F444_03491 [Phytophthora nicotianae P1976]|uniref:Uncharacterized protein n=1 Tax=Phytophthora nicotianae P1976 TaxID=1317066 RepID=A0A081AU06_PHYNI|nr:hypothetical protein F444_03491 [Phytophthora nicotianae P1976]